MSQLALTYSPAYAGREAWLAQLEVLRAAVIHLTPKEVLDVVDIAKSTLSEALNERNDKRWAGEWIHTIKAMLARRYDDVSIELLRKICEHDMTVTPYAIGTPQGLTPEQERDELRKEMARLEGGKAALSRVDAKGKKR